MKRGLAFGFLLCAGTVFAADAPRTFSLIREGGGLLQKGTLAEWVDCDGEKILKLGGGAPEKAGRMNWPKVDLERFRGEEFDFVFVYRIDGGRQVAGAAQEPFRPVCLSWWIPSRSTSILPISASSTNTPRSSRPASTRP